MKYALVRFLPEVPPGGVCAGIDWASADHAVCVVDMAGRVRDRFTAAHDRAGIAALIARLRRGGAEHPVATDNDYAVWGAFGNHYWPALYFADSEGRIRHHLFGEGEYGQSEMVIQQLLAEAGSTGAGMELVSVDPSGLEVPADWASLRSPENYTGYERTEGFASPGGAVPGKPHVYTVPARLALNQWALSGDWTMAEEATTLNAANGQIACRFHARDLNLVMGPATPGSPVRCRVLIDGQPPGEAHGTDVDGDGNGTVTQQRLHQLIRQPGRITDRTFEITFLNSGAQAYCFTFG